ncbi:hypothetical protein [Streptomyces uncialis]|uniref:hypothetical protein n=1 Tax=Streptomyces uncialis TaxID=1048205 RepID=UPI00386CAF51|nr:hypothetical protein OG268_16625 [Streptomyces uncialis]
MGSLKPVAAEGARTHIECVSGIPRCRAEPPDVAKGLTEGDAEAWAGQHFRATGHPLYDRVRCDTVLWEPSADTGPRIPPGVTG